MTEVSIREKMSGMTQLWRREQDGRDRSGPAARMVWWLPLAFVAFVLMALTVTPILVGYQVHRLRYQISDGSDAARVIVNDFEVAFSRQLLVRARDQRDHETAAARTRRESVNAGAVAREQNDEIALDSVVRRIGPDAVERFVELRTLARSWHNSLAKVDAAGSASDSLGTTVSSQSRSKTEDDLNSDAEDVLNSAQSLDNYLRLLSVNQRTRIQHLSRLNLISAVILAPLALAAALALFWAARRILFFAGVAEHDREALSRAMTSKAVLVRGLTHDLKNPLGAAYGYAELLEDELVGPLAPEQREMLNRIKGLVTLSVTTVDDLMELYRDGSDSVRIHSTPTDVLQIVTDVVADFQAEARRSGLTLALASPGLANADGARNEPSVPPLARTDPARVRQILGNLVSNALKYTPGGGHVWLSLRDASKADPRIAIDVRDTGPGIPPLDQERIFDEFFRLPSSREIAGTGIGLAISRRFARLLGGDLTVTDWFEGGSVFTLWLPAGPAESSRSPVRVA